MSRTEKIRKSVDSLTDGAGVTEEYAARIILQAKDILRDVKEGGVLEIPYPTIRLRIGIMREDAMEIVSAVENNLQSALDAYKQALLNREEGGEEAC